MSGCFRNRRPDVPVYARDEEYQEFLEKCDDYFYEIEKETERKNFTFIELEENEDEYNKLVEWLKKIT